MASVTQPVVGIERKDAARKEAVQLDAQELQAKNQEEERGLPVDERFANAAPDPVIDAEVEQRRERPDGFAVVGELAQKTRQKPGKHVHRQGQPLMQEQVRQRNQNAAAAPARRPPMTPIRMAPSKAMSAARKLWTQCAHQHAQHDRRAHDEDHLQLFAEGALFAKEQNAEAPRAHQHAADGRRDAKPNQQGDEDEAVVHWSVVSSQ